LLSATVACGGSGPASQPSPPPSPTAAATPTFVPIKLRSRSVGSKYIYLTKQKDNRKLYVLRADSETGEYFGQDTGRSDFTNPHVTFFDPHGRTMVADAPRGTVLEKDKSVVMSGGVHARTQGGMTLSCDTLQYNDETQLMHGDGNVVLTSPEGEQLRGQQIDADIRLSTVHVSGGPAAE
jgi:LPS export ABC transporter protein LptC